MRWSATHVLGNWYISLQVSTYTVRVVLNHFLNKPTFFNHRFYFYMLLCLLIFIVLYLIEGHISAHQRYVGFPDSIPFQFNFITFLITQRTPIIQISIWCEYFLISQNSTVVGHYTDRSNNPAPHVGTQTGVPHSHYSVLLEVIKMKPHVHFLKQIQAVQLIMINNKNIKDN